MPSLFAFMRVFIIWFLSLSCGGRSLASECGCRVTRATFGWIGLGYQPGALATWVQIPATPPNTDFAK